MGKVREALIDRWTNVQVFLAPIPSHEYQGPLLWPHGRYLCYDLKRGLQGPYHGQGHVRSGVRDDTVYDACGAEDVGNFHTPCHTVPGRE